MTLPTSADLAGAVVEDPFDDMISPPGLTNHWATVQVDHDVLAVRSLCVPPLSQGDTVSGRLYLGGRLAQAYGQPVRTRWFPDRVERETLIAGWLVRTTTVTPVGEPAVVVAVEITNTGPDRDLELGVWIDAAITRSPDPWLAPEPPHQANLIDIDGSRRWASPVGADGPVSLQGVVGGDGSNVVDEQSSTKIIRITEWLPAGAVWRGSYLQVIAPTRAEADAAYRRIAADVAAVITAAERSWDAELAAVFADGGPYPGRLPVLETSNRALRQLYWWGALGTIWFRRDNPASVLGRTYDTLMPRYWQTTTFIWDYSLSAHVHAQLDPGVLVRQVSHWVGLDIGRHFGTEWLTGGPVGYWYSVNEYALIRLVAAYLRYSGDLGFLDTMITGPDGGRRALGDHVRDWATAWRRRRTASGLADYGENDNLLECVPGYVHEVASLQAANVWCLRTAAEISAGQGRTADAARLRAEAESLVALVRTRYLPGQGFFATAHPDGALTPTRHCYDFATVGSTIAADLDPVWRAEMLRFFDTELRTPSWMRALSAADDDAGASVRPDHQWNGAYPAWPAESARAAIALGGADIVADWLPGLARTTRQGPPGQAHFVEDVAPTFAGGARKAPGQFPYLIDWACSSAGSWCELVTDSVFGVHVGLDGTLAVRGVLDHFDPDARLTGLRVRGEDWTVDRSGAHRP